MDWVNAPLVWLAIAILLFIAEVLGAAGFLIGAAVAALAMSALLFFVPTLAVTSQIFIYAVVAVVTTLVYFKFFRAAQPSNRNELPTRAEAMMGRRFTLDESITAGNEVRVQLGDSMWVVTSPQDIDEGTEVEVVDCSNMRLQVAMLN